MYVIQGRAKQLLNDYSVLNPLIYTFIFYNVFSFHSFLMQYLLVFSSQFLTKNPARRLGCVATEGGEKAVTNHTFFAGIDWEKLNRRELEPPFKPRIVSSHKLNRHVL